MGYKYSIISTVLALTVILFCHQGYSQSLNTADNFAVLGHTTVTNTGSSTVTGDVGVDPGSSVTGFVQEGGPGTVNGSVYTAGSVTLQAQNDAAAAYNDLVSLSSTMNLSGQDLGNRTLTPGVYSFTSSAQLTGPLILNAQGIDNAVFVF